MTFPASGVVGCGGSSNSAVAVEAQGGGLPCWCRAGEWRAHTYGRGFVVLACSGCGGFRIDPPPLQAPEQSERFYTDYYRTVGTDATPTAALPGARGAGFWRVAEQFPALTTVARRAVDVGCGDGHLCAELHAEGWPFVAGIEISRTRAERARRLYPELTFFDQPLPATPLEKNSLDLIVMEAVIEHLPTPLEILREFYEYLAPGGRIVLTTPNMDSGEFRFLRKRWTSMLAPHAHIFLFSPASFQRLLTDAGFSVEKIGSYHTPLFTPLQYLKRLGRGDLKGSLWRAHQDLGTVYGHCTRAGAMLFGIGKKPE
jgi:SAM-dependent methyltransferase